MSLWRAQKRYEANQDINELADDTLLAISLLRNQINEFGNYSEEDVRQYLSNGIELLKKIQTGVNNPKETTNYYVELASKVRKSNRQTKPQFNSELNEAIEILQLTQSDLDWRVGLNDVETLLRSIETLTSESSARNWENVKNNLAAGHR